MTQVSDRTMVMLKTALELEEKGQKYYQQAAETAKDELGRQIWKLLAGYEAEHIKKIHEIYESLRSGKPWSEDLASMAEAEDLGRLFYKIAEKQKEHIRADTSELEALGVGVDFESASVRFYQDHLIQAEDPLEKKFIEAIAAEERGHLNLLTDMRFYYTDPEGWLMEKERSGLDGV